MSSAAPLTFKDFLARVIDEGIAAVRKDYAVQNERIRHSVTQKLEGSVAGFEACRGRTVFELRQQLDLARKLAEISVAADRSNYWYHRCFYAEVEWVCNVVSAALQNQKQPTIVVPTARGWLRAAEILGVKGDMSLREFKESKEN